MILVTGAGGFVGRHLVSELRLLGIPVRAVIRRESAIPVAADQTVVISDISDAAALRQAAEGCSAIVHLAARTHVLHESEPDPLAAYHRVNVEGTRAAIDAALDARVPRFIFLSSVKVNGEGKAGAYLPGDAPEPLDAYGTTKLEAEGVVQAAALRGLKTTVIRPPLIYGPGVKGNFARLMALTRTARRIPLPLAGIRNGRSLVYVGNLTSAIIHLLSHTAAHGKTYLISDNEDVSTPGLIRAIGDAAGWNPRLFSCPDRILWGVARVLGQSAAASRLLGSLTVDPGELLRSGWRPPYSLAAGLRKTMQTGEGTR